MNSSNIHALKPYTTEGSRFRCRALVGLGTVGLWAALDGFAERAALPASSCPICGGRSCIPARFANHVQGSEGRSLEELEDLRHLYAHNYAGEADDVYFTRPRHLLTRNAVADLTCGAQFDGRRVQLELSHLQFYSSTVKVCSSAFSSGRFLCAWPVSGGLAK